MRILIVIILMLLCALLHAQTHTMPGSNVVPSGASLTINSGASITAAAGSTVTGFGSGGGGAPTTATYITQTADAGLSAEVPLSGLATGLLKSTITTGALTTITDNSTNWNTAFTQTRQWDGGSTGLVAATGRTSLALVPGTNVEVPLTFSTGLTRSTNTVTVNTSQNITTLSNLTTNGFVKTGGAVGTLSVDTATYQPSDADLTTWAGITPVAAVGTWIATPSSANLRSAVTDENGTGALLFSGATTPDFTTGFTIGAAAGSGKVMKGNGTNFVPSTETFAAPGTSGNIPTSDGTNWTSAAPVVTASNTVTFTNKRITKRSLALAAPTPAPSINADSTDVVHITGLTGAITSITMTGTPVEGDTLRIDFTDNGTARAITLGGSFEAGAAPLPTTTVISTRLDTVFYWNTVTSKWRCQASSASPTYPATAGAVGYLLRSDGTNFTSWPNQQTNASLTNLTVSTADIYLAGSSCVVAAGDFKAGGQYRCVFDMAKTAGTGSIVITLRIGTAGTTSDAAIQTFTFGAGTSVADLGVFDVVVNWRSVGSGTSAVVQGMCRASHQLTTTGLISNAAGWFVLGSPSPSSGFNSSTATTIGLSFNGSTAFAGTNTLVQSQLQQ